jgi:hypothetical protein
LGSRSFERAGWAYSAPRSIGVCPQPTPMGGDDGPANRESHSDSTGLCGVEWRENPLEMLRIIYFNSLCRQARTIHEVSRRFESRTKTALEMLVIHWLAEVTNNPILEGASPHLFVRVCGYEDRRNGVAGIDEMSVELNSTHSRHLNVGDQARGMRASSSRMARRSSSSASAARASTSCAANMAARFSRDDRPALGARTEIRPCAGDCRETDQALRRRRVPRLHLVLLAFQVGDRPDSDRTADHPPGSTGTSSFHHHGTFAIASNASDRPVQQAVPDSPGSPSRRTTRKKRWTTLRITGLS